jgi:hypothetical protein
MEKRVYFFGKRISASVKLRRHVGECVTQSGERVA